MPLGYGYKARYVAGIVAAADPGGSTLPQGSLYSSASQGYAMLEAGFAVQGATGSRRLHLRQLTSAGTPGAGVAAAKYDDDAPAAACTPFTTHTVGPTLGGIYHRYPVHNANQTGLLQVFHGGPISCPVGTANGYGFILDVALGTADVTFVWEE